MGSPEEDTSAKPVKMLLRRFSRRCLRAAAACCNRCFDTIDVLIKLLGPFFVLLAASLFSFEVYTYFFLLLPSLAYEEGWAPSLLVVMTVCGLFLFGNMLYNYCMAICVDPGLPPEWKEGDASGGPMGNGIDVEFGEKAVPPRQCQKCFRRKPPRAHHCSVCKRCVLKMDHHCPWVNNCVGYDNYRYFCLFLLYLAGCCVFIVAVFLDTFVSTILQPRRRGSGMSFSARQCVALSWMLAACILVALCALGGFHAYLVLTNQTTIEFHSNMGYRAAARRHGHRWRNPYDLGRRRNFQQVFGPNAVCRFGWLFPCMAKRPPGDGTHFPSASEQLRSI